MVVFKIQPIFWRSLENEYRHADSQMFLLCQICYVFAHAITLDGANIYVSGIKPFQIPKD